MTKKNILLLVFIVWNTLISAQQMMQLTNFSNNLLAINPAYAGSRDYPAMGMVYRNQWTGLNGAPQTASAFYHERIASSKMSWGINMNHDKMGPVSNTMLSANFAYRVKIKEGIRLSLALNPSMGVYRMQIAGLKTNDPNDPELMNNSSSSVKLNLGFGCYLQHEKWFVGWSVPRISQAESGILELKERRHKYLIAGYIFSLGKDLQLKCAFQLKKVKFVQPSIDMNTELILRNKLSIGGGVRNSNELLLLTSVYLSPQCKLGMSYDFTTGPLSKFGCGSLEVYLGCDLPSRQSRYISPKLF